MRTVALLRELWRLKAAVAVAAAFALLIALLMMFRIGLPPQSRHHEVGVASTAALVDTPSSQVVDIGGKDSAAAPTLPSRAALLASLLTSSPLKDEIARRAGIPSRTLIASGAPAGTTGTGSAELLTTGDTVDPDDPRASILTIETDTTLPTLTVNVTAPTPETATRLANGTIATLQAHLASVATADGIPATRRVVVKQLGPARAGVTTRGPSRLIAIAVALFVFLAACGALLFGVRLFHEWRRSEELDRLEIAWDDEIDPEAIRPAIR